MFIYHFFFFAIYYLNFLTLPFEYLTTAFWEVGPIEPPDSFLSTVVDWFISKLTALDLEAEVLIIIRQPTVSRSL